MRQGRKESRGDRHGQRLPRCIGASPHTGRVSGRTISRRCLLSPLRRPNLDPTGCSLRWTSAARSRPCPSGEGGPLRTAHFLMNS